MIIEDMTQMAQFVYDFYNQKIDILMLKRDLPQVRGTSSLTNVTICDGGVMGLLPRSFYLVSINSMK